jgi:hypothetical protein
MFQVHGPSQADVGESQSPEREMKRKNGGINIGNQKRKVVVTDQEAMIYQCHAICEDKNSLDSLELNCP